MIIEIQKLSPRGSTYTGIEPPEVLELEGDRFVRNIDPLAYDLFAERLGHELIVQGRVSAPLELLCSRCAEFFSTSVTDSSFLRGYDISDESDTVDVTPDLREAILLLLPTYPVCRKDCAGLCPQCGANLNEVRCKCVLHAGDARWEALDALDLE